MSKPHKSSKPKQLLVEGKNDQHVIWALCKQYDLPKDFSVELPNTEETDGIEALLDRSRKFALLSTGKSS